MFFPVIFRCTDGGGRELVLTKIVVLPNESEEMRKGQGGQQYMAGCNYDD